MTWNDCQSYKNNFKNINIYSWGQSNNCTNLTDFRGPQARDRFANHDTIIAKRCVGGAFSEFAEGVVFPAPAVVKNSDLDALWMYCGCTVSNLHCEQPVTLEFVIFV
ncbi:hypothetical protein L596_002697 [Steinernema carpocapsae]|uniref:Uncharacterized protein n=1 Tax=Steinernema carpocapsae TaxID=34508 RepID=A0A4U8UU23_STECR|nr:hypothetical protein L596_002697 [Steinernema carpocapsae]